jgi:hypothetical protein
MKVVCQHCGRVLKVTNSSTSQTSHGDCISYPDIHQCEGSKQYYRDFERLMKELKKDELHQTNN